MISCLAYCLLLSHIRMTVISSRQQFDEHFPPRSETSHRSDPANQLQIGSDQTFSFIHSCEMCSCRLFINSHASLTTSSSLSERWGEAEVAEEAIAEAALPGIGGGGGAARAEAEAILTTLMTLLKIQFTMQCCSG
jgi:hypothetical protein